MSDIPDSAELKAKYAEIAALKKAIDEQKHAQLTRYSPYPVARRGRGNYRGGYRGGTHVNPRNMSISFNEEAKEKGDSSETQKYVSSVSKGGMTLVNTNIYEQEIARLAKQNENAKKAREKMIQLRRFHLQKARVSRYRTETDSCDRISVDSKKYAVARNGAKLVPLLVALDDQNTLIWNEKTYYKKPNGTFQCKERGAYVRTNTTTTPHTNTHRAAEEPCRYFSRTGEYLPQCAFYTHTNTGSFGAFKLSQALVRKVPIASTYTRRRAFACVASICWESVQTSTVSCRILLPRTTRPFASTISRASAPIRSVFLSTPFRRATVSLTQRCGCAGPFPWQGGVYVAKSVLSSISSTAPILRRMAFVPEANRAP